MKKVIYEANFKMEEEIRNKYDEFLQIFFNRIIFIKNKIKNIRKNFKNKKLKIVNELFNDCYLKKQKIKFLSRKFWKYF